MNFRFRNMIAGAGLFLSLLCVTPAFAFLPDYVPPNITDSNQQILYKVYAYINYLDVCFAYKQFNAKILPVTLLLKENYEYSYAFVPKAVQKSLWTNIVNDLGKSWFNAFAKDSPEVRKNNCEAAFLYGVKTYNMLNLAKPGQDNPGSGE